jgi:glucose-1-phosphate cytidylyltransferase
MKVLILCGGSGTRMHPENSADYKNHSEVIEVPKPMITIGHKPIIWWIMKKYSNHGYKNFVLLVGFKHEFIKYYFNNPEHIEPDWNIEYSYAGINASKGDRIRKALKDGLTEDDDKDIMLAYGDDLCNVDISRVAAFHKKANKMVTLTSVKLVSNFGILKLDENNVVKQFQEKPVLDDCWINGGYIIMKKKVLNHIMMHNEDETDTFEQLAKKGQVQVFKHDGFWKTMNTIKDMQVLRELWNNGKLQEELGIKNSMR